MLKTVEDYIVVIAGANYLINNINKMLDKIEIEIEKEFDEKFFEALHDRKDYHLWLPEELKAFTLVKIDRAYKQSQNDLKKELIEWAEENQYEDEPYNDYNSGYNTFSRTLIRKLKN